MDCELETDDAKALYLSHGLDQSEHDESLHLVQTSSCSESQ